MEKKDNQKSENNFKSNHVHDDILPRSSLNLNKLILKFPEDKNQIPKIFPSKKEIFDRFNNFNTKDQNNFVNCSEIKNKNTDRYQKTKTKALLNLPTENMLIIPYIRKALSRSIRILIRRQTRLILQLQRTLIHIMRKSTLFQS